jgi:hypothetical protein
MWAAAIVLDSHPPCLHLAELISRAKIDLLGEVVPDTQRRTPPDKTLEKLRLVRYPTCPQRHWGPTDYRRVGFRDRRGWVAGHRRFRCH